MSTPRSKSSDSSKVPATVPASAETSRAKSKKKPSKVTKTSDPKEASIPEFDPSKYLNFTERGDSDEDHPDLSPPGDYSSGDNEDDPEDPSDDENPEGEKAGKPPSSAVSSANDRMRFYRSVTEHGSLSDYSLTDIIQELIAWSKYWSTSLTTAEQLNHLHGVGLLKHVMGLLSSSLQEELAKRFVKLHATAPSGDLDLLQLASSCTVQLQHVHMSINHSDATVYKSAFSKLQYLENCAKPFVTTPLSVDATPSELVSYKDALAATGAIRNWTKLWTFHANIPGNSRTAFSMLRDVKLFQESFIEKYSFITTDFEKNQSLSLYLAVMSTLTPLFKAELQMYKTIFKTCGVKLLYFVFRRCEERNARCIVSVARLLDNLPQFIADNSYNLHVVCSALITRILDYKSAGNSLTQVYLPIKQAFLGLKISAFTQKLNLWQDRHCSTAASQQDPSTVIEYLKAVPEMMDQCIDDKSWPKDKTPIYGSIPKKAVKFSQPVVSPDIAAFQAQVTTTLAAVKDSFTSIEAHVSSLASTSKSSQKKTIPSPAAASGNSAFTTVPHKTSSNGKDIMVWAIGPTTYRLVCGTGPFEYGPHQWGKSGLYPNAHAFLQFVSGAAGQQSVHYNGNHWHWCDKCKKLTSHSSQQHTKRPNRKRKTPDSSTQEPPPLTFLSQLVTKPSAGPETTSPAIYDADADAHSLLASPQIDDE